VGGIYLCREGDFHIGVSNTRSQNSMLQLGAKKIGEEIIAYFGEPDRLNYVYEIRK